MQIMLIRLAPENELRYVIGVIQQYVGVIIRNRPTEQRRSRTPPYKLLYFGVNPPSKLHQGLRSYESKQLYPPEVLLPPGVLLGLSKQGDLEL